MKGCIIAISVASILLAGCHEPAPPTEPTSARVQALDEAEFDRLWEAVLTVLRDHNFTPFRRDRRAGVIETLPTTAQSWFEFWRKDTVGTYETAEANLHTIRKYVIVRLTKAEPAGNYGIEVEVQAERLEQPERQITSSSAAIRSFSREVPTYEGKMPGDPVWAPLGRDAKMEELLLGRILARHGQPVEFEEKTSNASASAR